MTRANGRRLAAVRLAILMTPILLHSSGVASAQVRAFPEAEGFGAFATGGRGGTVYHVTNLNDSGAGSFRDAVSTGNRIVVFDVGGWIELASPVSVQDNITIAGQTAPGEGIGLKNYGISFSNADNVIARHLRVRQGPYVDSVGRDAVGATGASNVIFDHISASWGRDENFSINNSTNITIQNSIIAEGLLNHSMGGLIEWNEGISIHHSLYISNNDRNPKTKGILDFTNNVVFNWGAFAYVAGDSAGLSYGNVVNNYFIAGPSSSELHDPISRGNRNYSMYLDGNYYDGNLNGVLDGTPFTAADVDDELTYVPERFDYPLVDADTATAGLRKGAEQRRRVALARLGRHAADQRRPHADRHAHQRPRRRRRVGHARRRAGAARHRSGRHAQRLGNRPRAQSEQRRRPQQPQPLRLHAHRGVHQRARRCAHAEGVERGQRHVVDGIDLDVARPADRRRQRVHPRQCGRGRRGDDRLRRCQRLGRPHRRRRRGEPVGRQRRDR